MKNIINEFMKLLSNLIIIICFSIASFLLITNIFHYKEISRNQRLDILENTNYKKYKDLMSDTDTKMKSVNINNPVLINSAKPIFEHYNNCIKVLNESTFEGFKDQKTITNLELYNSNSEMLDEYNNTCIFNITYNIEKIGEKTKYKNNFNAIKKYSEDNKEIILENTNYIIKSLLNNSTYSYSTDESRTIYNKINNDLNLTINNYKAMAEVLNKIANWYVLEFGGMR